MAKILIVDDVSSNRKFLVTLLSHHGHVVIEASDGSEGLAAVRASVPDLVITDVLMPVMDGYEFVSHLRLDPATSKIPVVFYTAHYGAREARALAQSIGVSCVLTKPAEPGSVLEVVERVLAGEFEPALPSDASCPTATTDREHLRLVTNKLSEKSQDLRAANARLRALINIGLELASEPDAGRLLDRVCAGARDLFGATYVTLGILDLTDQTVRRVVTCGTDAAEWVKTGDSLSEVLTTVVGQRQTLRGESPVGDVQTFLAAPVASHTQVYGWICFVGNEGRAFTEDDEDLVRALSGQLGRIYESRHFHDLAERRSQELAREIGIRQEAVEALRIAEERMRFALESAKVGIWDRDYASGSLRWSPTLEAHHGVETGKFGETFEAFIERIHPEDRASTLEAFGKAESSGSDFTVEYRSVWPDGTVRLLSGRGRVHLGADGEPVRAVGITLDVTERCTLEAQYLQAQKMEAIGRLAGGVAHDFNNLLTVMLGYCDCVLASLDPSHPSYADVGEIQQAAVRAAALTRQLLAFGRKAILEPAVLNLNDVVVDMRALIRRLVREDVVIVVNLQPSLSLVRADRAQVEQIVLNLVVNARDAMPAGGTLTLATANAERDARGAKTQLQGTFATLTVSDTGTGMTSEVRERLFEPFFTTKSAGSGTGLGLATVHGIVMQSGGSISVQSVLGRGTSLTVYLPTADVTHDVVAPLPLATARPRAGTETVLVVEDSDGLRELTRRLLQRHGYTVLTAASGTEALRQFDANPSVDVLLTDVVMPGLGGPELARRLVERRPALQVIYMSGYMDDAISHDGVVNPGIAFLHKPFTSDTLGRKLREVLDSTPAGSAVLASP